MSAPVLDLLLDLTGVVLVALIREFEFRGYPVIRCLTVSGMK